MTPAEKGITTFPVYTFDGRAFSKADVDIIQETPLQIFLNGRHLATIACTGLHVDELALGYLKSEGFIKDSSDIKDVRIDSEAGAVQLLTAAAMTPDPTDSSFSGSIASSGARTRFGESHHHLSAPIRQDGLHLSPEQVLQLMDRFIDLCCLHRITRGTHGAALTDGKEILVVREDIGRHNALDMLAGYALSHHWDCSDKVILRTGRVSTEIVYKVWSLGIPVVVSLAAPTARAIELAGDAGITLIGAMRGRSMQVYTHERRVSL
ncbi:MAG: formate dehydrogenase family accessory protein FdhD [Deltaproteobacteria bacterium HGW-Deltaproteobacteria-11]|nr:MAG: formate dehydrogenase family accessory protein FdhD [Deltaproteobacteria bacterium HGW-Deltaproteobacteria-11]